MAQILGLWVTCGVKMMSLCHGWSWPPPQIASHIHIRYIHSVWAHWYAVHGHMVVDSNSYTHNTWLIIWGAGSLVESKWCHYIVGEADSHPKLLPISILDMYIKCLSTLICCPYAYGSSLTQLYPPYLAQIWGSWSLESNLLSLRHGCWQPPQAASRIHIRHTNCLSTLICCP